MGMRSNYTCLKRCLPHLPVCLLIVCCGFVSNEKKSLLFLVDLIQFFPQEVTSLLNLTMEGSATMPKFVIEREIPGAGNINAQDMQAISQKSCSVLKELGPQIQWVQSYVTDDKIYCVYIAPNKEMVLEHAQKGGFPANSVSEVKRIIDPTTAE